MPTNSHKRVGKAIAALIHLAETPRGTATSTELGLVLDLNAVEVRRLLGPLRYDGVVEARSGPKGGWALALEPSRITLGRVHAALAGEPEMLSPVTLDEAMAAAEKAYRSVLDEVTLEHLLG